MNPAIMGAHPLRSSTVWQVVDTERQGDHPGHLVYASSPPVRNPVKTATGPKQIMAI